MLAITDPYDKQLLINVGGDEHNVSSGAHRTPLTGGITVTELLHVQRCPRPEYVDLQLLDFLLSLIIMINVFS